MTERVPECDIGETWAATLTAICIDRISNANFRRSTSGSAIVRENPLHARTVKKRAHGDEVVGECAFARRAGSGGSRIRAS
jgi:hypothetical protein